MKIPLTPQEMTGLLATLQARFEQQPQRHPSLNWQDVLARLQDAPQALASLQQMELSGGEPDVVGRDSAGGNLVLTLLMKLRDGKLPLPTAAACLSPVTDLTEDKQLDPTIHDPVLSMEIMHFYNNIYLTGNDPHDPLISPAHGDLHGFPPLLIHVGEE